MSRRSSRPSSAASHSSRSSNSDGDFKLECKAAYLTVFNDIRDEITSKDDLILVLQQTGRNPTQRTLEKYWKDTTESLSFNDFVDICHHEPATTTDDLMKAFRKIDVNGDGYLSVNELVNTLSTKGEKMSRDEVKAIISDVDENNDGKLDYREFCNMVMKTTEEAKKMALKVMERKERKKQKSRQSISSKKDETEVSSEQQETKEEKNKSEDVTSSRTSVQSKKVKNEAEDVTSSRSSVQSKKVKNEGEDVTSSRTSVQSKKLKNEEEDVTSSRTSVQSKKLKNEAEDVNSSRTSVQSKKVKNEGEDVTSSRTSVQSKKMKNEGEDVTSSRTSVQSKKLKNEGEDVTSSRSSVQSKKVKNEEEDVTSSRTYVQSKKLKNEGEDVTSSRSSVQSKKVKNEGEDVTSSRTSVQSKKLKNEGEDVTSSRSSVQSKKVKSEGEDVNSSRTSLQSKNMKNEDEDVGSSRMSLQAESVNQKNEDDINASRTSLQSGSVYMRNDLPKPSPRSNKERGRQAIRSHLPEPSNLQKWTHNASKGCFYLEEGSIMSHQYTLELSESTSVWMTIEPVRIGEGGVDKDGNPIDTILFVLRDKPRSQSQRVVTFTEMRDAHGKFGVRCDLDAGKYKLIPFSTGCRLRPSRHHSKQDAKLVDKDKHNKFILTKAFRRALEEIFEMVDLDGNGRLSREEFSLYTWRTSGEGVADEEWEVVETSCDLVNGEITKEGFIHLTEMEAQETEGEEKELWITLENMGYNKSLDLCEACPFQLDVYTEECDDAKLLVSTLEPTDAHVEDAVCETVLAKGDSKKVKGNSDLTLYSYIGDARASLVLKNNSSSQPSVELDCSNSRNCVSNQSKLKHTVSVPARATVVGLHLIPADERSEWLVQCTERIVK